MKQRCDGTGNEANRKRYHDRGIRVCDEWYNSFETFMKWSLENGYQDNLTLDRIDNNGNYEPSNCRWANAITQQNNVSTNKYLQYKGKTQTMAEWAREYNMKYTLLQIRLRRGWPIEKALEAKAR
jgi:hypothetical protein